jgi:hypothetical protein
LENNHLAVLASTPPARSRSDAASPTSRCTASVRRFVTSPKGSCESSSPTTAFRNAAWRGGGLTKVPTGATMPSLPPRMRVVDLLLAGHFHRTFSQSARDGENGWSRPGRSGRYCDLHSPAWRGSSRVSTGWNYARTELNSRCSDGESSSSQDAHHLRTRGTQLVLCGPAGRGRTPPIFLVSARCGRLMLTLR